MEESSSDFCFFYAFMDILPIHTNFTITMPSGTSSSEDEVERGQPKEDKPVHVFADPVQITTSTPATSSKSSKNDKMLPRMLQLVLEAVRMVPADNPEKGISIQKIKTYLRSEHHIRKAKMQDELRTTLETAIERKMLMKTTGKGVLTGSVRLNPAYREAREANPPPVEDSDSSDEEPAVEEKPESRKRKAVKEAEAEGGSNKRRK